VYVELRQLAVFVAVAEERNFTRAAGRLHLVQSAASASIRSLEAELGASLFDRTTQRVDLTDAGRALLPEARQALAAAQDAVDVVASVRSGARGTVVLGALQSSAMRTVRAPTLLALYAGANPGISLHIRHAGGSLENVAAVAAGTMDLAFTATPVPCEGVTLHELAREEMHLVCAPDHPLAGRASVRLAELSSETFADVPETWGLRSSTERTFLAAGVARRLTYEIDDLETLIELVGHGAAVAVLPPSVLPRGSHLATSRIRRPAPEFVISIAAPATRQPSFAARGLLAFLLNPASG